MYKGLGEQSDGSETMKCIVKENAGWTEYTKL